MTRHLSSLHRPLRTLAVGVACLGAGAGAGAIATAGASTPTTAHPAKPHPAWRQALRRAVHGEFVVHTARGFATITYDRGFVQSVHGDVLTLREGTAKATYKVVTLTIPAGARVRNNGRRAALASLASGERVAILQAPARTTVRAHSVR